MAEVIDAWNRYLGASQGRIKPEGITAPAGEYVFCLGVDRQFHSDDLQPGDFAQIEQIAAFAPGTKLFQVSTVIKPPASCPPGFKWVLEILLNDQVKVSYRLNPGGRTRVRHFSINVSKGIDPVLAYAITLRIRFLTDDLQQYIANASYDLGETGNFVSPVYPVMIPTASAFGTPVVKFSKTVSPSGLASAFVSGTAKLNLKAFMNGIASAFAAGTPAVMYVFQTLSPVGVATSYASGTAKLNRFASGVGNIATNYATGSATIVVAPANLSLEGWWQNWAGGTTWNGKASAGGSATQELTEATNPPGSSTLNGWGVAVFDATNDILTSESAASQYATTTNYSGWALVNMGSISTNDTSSAPSGNKTLFSTNGTNQHFIYFRSGGGGTVGMYQFIGTGDRIVETAFPTAQWNLIQYKANGTNILIRVNGNSWASATGGTINSLASLYKFGINTLGNQWLGGSVAEIAMSKSFIGDGTFDTVRTWISARYGVSV